MLQIAILSRGGGQYNLKNLAIDSADSILDSASKPKSDSHFSQNLVNKIDLDSTLNSASKDSIFQDSASNLNLTQNPNTPNQNNSTLNHTPIAFHLITDTLKPSTIAKLRKLESKLNALYPASITLHHLSQDEFKDLRSWGEAGQNWCAYFRLKLGDILAPSLKTCLYLDVDTFVLQDIRPLFEMDLEGKSIAMVRDVTNITSIVKDNVVKSTDYCNSGMLFIDLDKWRTKDMSQIRGFKYNEAPDQDFINYIFKNEKKILAFQWNFLWFDERRLRFDSDKQIIKNGFNGAFDVIPCVYSLEEFRQALQSPVIVHFICGYKPWEKIDWNPNGKPEFVKHPYDKAWWQIAKSTPFFAEIKRSYTKRSFKVSTLAYLKYYAPFVFYTLRAIKRALKGVKVLPAHKTHQECQAYKTRETQNQTQNQAQQHNATHKGGIMQTPLHSQIFNLRYINRNSDNAFLSFMRKNYKKFITDSPSRMLKVWRLAYLAPLLVFRKCIVIFSLRKNAWLQCAFLTKDYKDSRLCFVYCFMQKVARKILLTNFIVLFLRPYFRFRVWRGKVDIPYFELVLTTRCTMRCESCNNLMQYFDSNNAYTCTLEGIRGALEKLFANVDSISYVRIIGGEPLLFKDIAKVVEILDFEPKVKNFDIVTNGTIIPKQDLLIALSRSYKSWVSISDYSTSPNLKIKLYQEKITHLLQEYRIAYHLIWQQEGATWWDPGKIYKRGRDKEEIIKNFKSCLMPCVSVMSNEAIATHTEAESSAKSTTQAGFVAESKIDSIDSIDSVESVDFAESMDSRINPLDSKRDSVESLDSRIDHLDSGCDPAVSLWQGKDTQKSCGQIFICPIASSLSRLKGLAAFEGDFVELDSTLSREKILRFYAQEFFEACDYCHNMWEQKRPIKIAIQTDKVLSLTE
ncbi:glycosyltransferase [Helicobacter fennelliae]|uniref:glycosyltransferase n=2 Tax=Helicobacter fennelliae TaxID=215 RepID=UPI000E18479E|nr:glycosyltransferase [Helicobacter fennelliae]STP06980.1 lipopolysaccharide 1,3-galactosyltransferase [Helicobacter fennelliae]